MSKCYFCGKEIEFKKTEQGKFLPVEIGGMVEYNDCEPHTELLTREGRVVMVSYVGSYPYLQGYKLHRRFCGPDSL